ncbi:hypothetical protein K8R33_03420 [archaeon]|nr:hypothetical protein [archaeon]
MNHKTKLTYFLFFLLVFIFGLYYQQVSPYDYDDGRTIAEISHIGNEKAEYITSFNVPVIQDSLYLTMWEIGIGNQIFGIFSLFFTILLFIIISVITFKLTKSHFFTILNLIVLLGFEEVFVRTMNITLYPLATFYIYLGLLFVVHGIKQNNKVYLSLGSIFVIFSFYVYQISIFIFPLPLIIAFLSNNHFKQKINYAKTILISQFIVFLPWLINNFNILDPINSFKREYKWFIINGYLDYRNEVWGIKFEYNSFLDIFSSILKLFNSAINQNYLIIIGTFISFSLILILIDCLKKHKINLFEIGFVALLFLQILLFIIVQPGLYQRYVYISLPVISYFFISAIKKLNFSKRSKVFLLILLLIFSVITLNNVVLGGIRENQTEIHIDLKNIADLIDNEKGIIGSRPALLATYSMNNPIFSSETTPEEDYVDFLIWNSNEEVLKIFNKYNIGWILISKPETRYEIEYHGIWLREFYNTSTQHLLNIQNQGITKLIYDGNRYALYKVDNEQA